jgi:hypothetical protein
MWCPLASFVAVALSGLALGCSAPTLPRRPVGLPPTPQTVTVRNPGGDAADPEWAALERLAGEPWGSRRDRFNSLIIPLVDARHWQRVKLWGYPSRAAFRFGDDHHGVLAVWYRPTTEATDPESCLARFVAEARPAAELYGARILESHLVHTVQRAGLAGLAGLASGAPPRPQSSQAMVVQVIDAEVAGFFGADKEWAGALAAYPSWPGTCLIQGFVVAATKHKALAGRIRDRWVTEGATALAWHPRLSEAPAFDDK